MLKKTIRLLRIAWATLVTYTIGNLINVLLEAIVLPLAILELRPLARAVTWTWANLFFWLIGKNPRVRGREFMHKGKKYLILSNHGSLYDIPAIMILQPEISWLAKEYLFKIPLLGQVLRKMNAIPVARQDIWKSRESLQQAIKRARKNFSIGIFPEGTRTVTGQMQRFKRGFIFILRHSPLDALPVTINGTFQLKPKNRFFIDPTHPLEIVIHRPLANKELVKLTDQEISERVRSIIAGDYRG